MKIRSIVFLTAWIAALLTHGQSVPEILNYQGRILDEGQPFDGVTNVVVALYDSESAGIQLFVETQTVDVVKGFYSLQMGSVNTTGLADALDSPEVYLETTIGTNVLSPRERVLASAYAIYAKNAETAKTAETADNYLPLTGGTLTGPVITTSTLKLNNWEDLTANSTKVDIGTGAGGASGVSVAIGDEARAYSNSKGSVAVGAKSTARYRIGGVAIGYEADGDYNGIGIGYSADGQYSNIAIGYASSAYSGYDRIAIGRSITNRRNDTCAIRGDLYMDGGNELYYRPTVGSGSWTVKAFTIPHPLDPENKVLRHYCMESPVVWNVYAGNVELRNGKAEVDLPDYYSVLNLEGSEVYTLTPIGSPASLYVEREVAGNRFVIGGDVDVKVSWTLKVKRNDPGCLSGLKDQPVEQSAEEMDGHKEWLKAQQHLNSK